MAFLHAQDEKLFFGAQIGQLANSVWQNLAIKLAKFSTVSKVKNVGETEWRIFCQTLCAGDFSLGEQSLVKLTPAVNNFLIYV